MLKPLIICASLVGSLYANANTIEIATDLFANRGDDVMNASKAADIYGDLAAAEEDTVKKAELLVSQSEAIYFYGTKQTTKAAKIKVHNSGAIVGIKASDMLKGDNANKSLRARALYFYGSNKGKWALAQSKKESLKLFRKVLKPQMETLINLDETVEQYGVYRILGLAYAKVPKILGGDKKKGMRMLAKAFEATKIEYNEDYVLSMNTTTNIYYLFAIAKNKKYPTLFCNIAESVFNFAEEETREFQDAHNPVLIPETQMEIATLLDPSDDDETHTKVVDYYEAKCN